MLLKICKLDKALEDPCYLIILLVCKKYTIERSAYQAHIIFPQGLSSL